MTRLNLTLVAFLIFAPTLTMPSRAADEPKQAEDKKDKKKSEEQKKAEAEARAVKQAQLEVEAKARAERQAALEAEMKAKAAAKAEKDRLEAEAAAAKAALKVITDRGDGMLKRKITRKPDEAFLAVTQMNSGGDKNLPDDERYVLYVQAGEWEKMHDLIAPYPSDFPQRLYNHVLNDLTQYGNRPLLLPTDVLRLADAAPGGLNDQQTLQIGRLLSYAVSKLDSRAELVKLLNKGTKTLGGTDPAKRRAAARALAVAEFWAEAKEFGLAESEIPAVTAGAADLSSNEPAKLPDSVWNEILAALGDKNRPAAEREEALTKLHQALIQSTPQVVSSRLGPLVGDAAAAESAWEIVALVGRKTSVGLVDFDFDARRINMELQQTALRLLGPSRKIDAPPGQTLANLYARNWQTEAQNTLTNYPSWKKTTTPEGREKNKHVPIETMLDAAPAGRWLSALEPQVSGAVKLLVAKLILLSDDADRLLPLLPDFVTRDRDTAGELANAYLSAWAQKHDPNFTPDVLKRYKLDGQAIVLTRAEQEQSLRQLGSLLGKLDAATRKLLDEVQLVRAFDLCHSKAEIYTFDHVTAVFGPLANLSPTLVLSLVEQMRTKLSSNWRQLSVQRDAATRRTTDDVFQLVNDGYGEADRIATEWLSAHADDWRMASIAGSLLADWAEFSYFQAVASENNVDRFATYLKRNAAALGRFRASAKAYAAVVPKLKRTEFELLPYRAWFYGLLGIAHDGDINLRKGVTKDGLAEIRAAMAALPAGAADVHIGLFSTMVADNVKANVIAPEMKYRYLSSAVEITGRKATAYPAQEKVQYYDSLLSEIRLQARLDGSDRIRTGGPFGVFVTLVHTADLARESGGFGKYLQNEIRRVVNGKNVTEQPFYRDRFEEALRLALGDFFDIRAIVFADPAAGARDLTAEEAGVDPKATSRPWQETPLAYVYLVPKDATVDRVPPLEIELDFFDRDGKVVVPVPANPLLIDVADDVPARRPVANLAITEIVDGREMTGKEPHLKIDVIATAQGLVPDLEELIELKGYGLPVTQIDEREGLLVREFVSSQKGMHASSERSWTVHLDPTPLLRGAGDRIEFAFPKPKSDEIAIVYKRYEDLDPIEAAATVTLVEGEAAALIAKPNYAAWGMGTVAGLAVVGLVVASVVRRKPNGAHDQAPLFTMPPTLTPFSTVGLLTRIQNSPRVQLSDEQRTQLKQDITTLERAAFATKATAQSPRDLESLARRWLDTATSQQSPIQNPKSELVHS